MFKGIQLTEIQIKPEVNISAQNIELKIIIFNLFFPKDIQLKIKN